MAEEVGVLVGVEEAASRLGVARRTVARMIELGDLSAVRVGRRVWGIDPAALTQVSRRQRGRPPSKERRCHEEGKR